MKKKKQFPKIDAENDIRDVLNNMSIYDILIIRDETFSELTKQALSPVSIEIEKFILHYAAEKDKAFIQTVERVMRNVIRISGICLNSQNEQSATFSFILPIHLIKLATMNNSINDLLIFTDEFKLLLENKEINENEIKEIMEEFTNNEFRSLKMVDSFNAKANFDYQNLFPELITKNLSIDQQFVFDFYKNNGTVN